MVVHSSTPGQGTQVGTADEPLDEVFEALANARRRAALDCLANASRSLAVADLADEIARREATDADEPVSKPSVQAVRTTLRHTHLPKLASVDAVEWNRDRTTVRIADSTNAAEQLRRYAADCDRAE